MLFTAGVACANTYVSWNPGSPNGSLGPHTGYITTSQKCAVCHSVHTAPETGDTANGADSSGQQTQLLLATSVANACSYCHITTSIGGVQLYGGNVNYYLSNSWGHGPFAGCSGCHSVHGANTFQGYNQAKILRYRGPSRPIQPEIVADGVGRNAAVFPIYPSTASALNDGSSVGGKYYQQMAFCSQCHRNYSDSADATITNGPGFFGPAAYKTHSMVQASPSFSATNAGPAIDAAGASSGPRTANGATVTGIQVAYVNSNTCRNCHDAGGVDQTGVTFESFPHYTAGYSDFVILGSSPNTTDAPQAPGTGVLEGVDGMCLKCHINTGATSGVGITF